MKESTSYYRISDLSASDRPRERLAEKGAEALQTPELLAILLRTGIAGENAVQLGQRILNDFKGLTGLHKASFAELASQRGLGVAKAAQIKAAIELGRRRGIYRRATARALGRSAPGNAFVLLVQPTGSERSAPDRRR